MAASPQTKPGTEVTAEPTWKQRVDAESGPILGPEINLLEGFRALLAALQSGTLPCHELGQNELGEKEGARMSGVGIPGPSLAHIGSSA